SIPLPSDALRPASCTPSCTTTTIHSLPTTFFFFNDPPPPEISTLSLHDALPISCSRPVPALGHSATYPPRGRARCEAALPRPRRSEEHTSELQSLTNLVCRLLLEKKKTTPTRTNALV